jgi:FdhE protein
VTTQVDSKVAEQLTKWKHRAPNYIELHRRLLQLKVENSYLLTLGRHISEISERFAQANFILQFEDLLPDWPALERLFQEGSSIIGEYIPSTAPTTSALEKLITHPLLMKEAARAWYHYSLSISIANEMGVDREMLSLCFKSAFHPVLIRYSEKLSPLVNQDAWRKCVCPICGGKPDFAFLNKEAGARWLICSRCDAEWLFSRIECPFCGNRDQDTLAYFTDEKELYRLYTCERCRSYIKTIDLRRTEGEVLFPLERILTLDLDRQAVEAGYKRELVATESGGNLN